jgi:hypothetical protein
MEQEYPRRRLPRWLRFAGAFALIPVASGVWGFVVTVLGAPRIAVPIGAVLIAVSVIMWAETEKPPEELRAEMRLTKSCEATARPTLLGTWRELRLKGEGGAAALLLLGDQSSSRRRGARIAGGEEITNRFGEREHSEHANDQSAEHQDETARAHASAPKEIPHNMRGSTTT